MTWNEFIMTFPGGMVLGLMVVLPVWGLIALVSHVRLVRGRRDLENKIRALRESRKR